MFESNRYANKDCYERDIDFYGFDLNNQPDDKNYAWEDGKRNSPLECQKLCQSTKECKAFTYYPRNGHCWLKTSDSDRREFGGMISGPKHCDMKGTHRKINIWVVLYIINKIQ